MRNSAAIAIGLALSVASTPFHADGQVVSQDLDSTAKVVPETAARIRLISCVVTSARDAGPRYDCMSEARSELAACNNATFCEIPIGVNLTNGKDIDPGTGFLGKRVTIAYSCGTYSMQGGPYEQDDHATVVLDCNGMWW